MTTRDELALRFEAERPRLRRIAFRMLGSLDEADDAVQAAWLRADSAGVEQIDNLPAWLTTVVSRVCLDQLRSRRARPETSLQPEIVAVTPDATASDPEQSAAMAEEVGHGLLLVLGRLPPAERVAFVLHDLFAVPFDEIGTVVGRTPVAAKKLASRARARIRGSQSPATVDATRHIELVEAFLAASRDGDMHTLLQVLAPDVVRTADRYAIASEARSVVRGATAVAEETRVFTRLARAAAVLMLNGAPGIAVASGDRLIRALEVEIVDGRIVAIDVIGDPSELSQLELTLPPGTSR